MEQPQTNIREPGHRYRPLLSAPPPHASLNLAGYLTQPPALLRPRELAPILWCFGNCQAPRRHLFAGTVQGQGLTTYQVFTCAECFGRRICGCY